jgi:MoxR-like ATPase
MLPVETLKHVPDQARKTLENILVECRKIVVGKSEVVEDLLVALLSEGHVLMGGVPGVAKTTIAKTFSRAVGLDFRRIQCSPDILPADIVGTHIFNPKTGSFRLEKGPIFSNIVLIDEINRNTPKTNSAVLEAMQERQATIEGETQRLPYPFLVIATRSPIEFHGVFPLPEVLIDRFLLGLKVGYPSLEEELEITDKLYSIEQGEMKPAATKEQIADLIKLTKQVFLAPQVRSYIVDLVQRTRDISGISLGAGPRASIALTRSARARALVKGRLYVLPDDVKYLAPRALCHRMVLSVAQGAELSTESFVSSLLEDTPIPSKQP